MTNWPSLTDRSLNEDAVMKRFLDAPSEEAFSDFFVLFTPQLVAFFRSRGSEPCLAEDLAQEVMLTVYRKASQLRDRKLFRAWVFKIARNALCRHYGKQTREVDTVDLSEVADRFIVVSQKPSRTTACEFLHWMTFLDSREQEVMTLRFIEEWEYHEIAAAQAIPIGTVQWRVFNAKKKLIPYLKTQHDRSRDAA